MMNSVQGIEQLKSSFKEALMKTRRKGMDKVVAELESLGFFTAPASTRFHLNIEGGLLLHSYNVCEMALMLREQVCQKDPSLIPSLPIDSIVIASLLHDTCKSNIYKKCIRREMDSQGLWHDVESYEVDNSDLPVGHGEKSVIMLLRMGLELTDDEIMAIRWHMAPWDLAFQSYEQKMNLNSARDRSPLCSLIALADGIASSLLERKANET